MTVARKITVRTTSTDGPPLTLRDVHEQVAAEREAAVRASKLTREQRRAIDVEHDRIKGDLSRREVDAAVADDREALDATRAALRAEMDRYHDAIRHNDASRYWETKS